MSLSETMIEIPAEHEKNVFGQFDAYAKKLERDVSRHVDCTGWRSQTSW